MRWRIAILVSFAIAISYLDRQTLPVAIGAIRGDFPISNSVKAFLDSAFLLTYGLMYVVGGRLIDVLGTRRGFLLIMIFWSLACASHGFATGVIMLAASRLLLGAGEGGGTRYAGLTWSGEGDAKEGLTCTLWKYPIMSWSPIRFAGRSSAPRSVCMVRPSRCRPPSWPMRSMPTASWWT